MLELMVAGLGAGGGYALLALGTVMIYRGSGVVNFAGGGLALVGGFTYYELATVHRAPAALAVLAGVLVAAVVGAVVQLAVMSPMRRASSYARIVATLGVLGLIQQGAKLHYDVSPHFVASFLPTDFITVRGTSLPIDRLMILALTVVLAAGLWALYRFTRFGIATTAVAENPRATACMGWDPTFIATVNWAMGGALCGLAGTVLTSVVNNGISYNSLTLTIVPALSAALVGSFRSFPLTVAGGLVIGVLEALALKYVDEPGAASVIPFLVILVLMLVRGRGIPLRSYRSERLPSLSGGLFRLRTAVPAGVVIALVVAGTDSSDAPTITTAAIVGILCLSLVVVFGYAGQLSLAQYGLAGIGALFAARLSATFDAPLLLTLIVSVLLTVPIGILIALPSVRVRGANLAVITLGVATVISDAVLGNQKLTMGKESFGVRPPLEMKSASIFGYEMNEISYAKRYAVFALVLLALLTYVASTLRRSRSGRSLIAMRGNERAAMSVGVSVPGAKLYAFAVGSGMAAVAGVLLAYRDVTVQFGQFSAFESINLVLLTVVGGLGSVAGAAIGGAIAAGAFVENVVQKWISTGDWYSLVASGLLILTVILNPNGVALAVQDGARLLWARVVRSKRPQPSAHPGEDLGMRSTDQLHRVAPKTLELRDVTVRFGPTVAVKGLSLTVSPGEVVGLIGPNGAGKTTVIDCATGFNRGCSGDVVLDGVSLNGLSPTRRTRAGLTRSFQSLELFEDLTIRDNLRAASDTHGIRSYFSDLVYARAPEFSDAVWATIDEFHLRPVLDKFPRELPYGQRRLVAIARAVATGPSVLLLDEPAAGLDHASTEELGELIGRLAKDWGMGILLVEHDVPLVLATCDRIVALNFGTEISTGTPAEVRSDRAVIEAYLGSEPYAAVGEEA